MLFYLVLALLLPFQAWAEDDTFLPNDNLRLVFSEEFNGKNTDLDDVWGFKNSPAHHIKSSRWRENVLVENGFAKLLVKAEKRGGQDWTTASMWTQRTFKYGYFVARYRYAPGSGVNNAFWLSTHGRFLTRLSKDDDAVKRQFEIDINEGHYPRKINTNYHLGLGRYPEAPMKFKKLTKLSKKFHEYGLLWTEKELVWYFDGDVLRREKNDGRFDFPVSVLLSTAVIDWAGNIYPGIDGKSMDVDYVRVYQAE